MQVRKHMTRVAGAGITAFVSAVLLVAGTGPMSAQSAGPSGPLEEVEYWNEADSTFLTATLARPRGSGPFPGVVLLSIAGTDPLVQRLLGDGYAVLMPVRRGFVSVEPLLRATYEDLAMDARAAVDYMAARVDIDADAIALVGQGDDAPAAMLAAGGPDGSIPLVLLEPPAMSGAEVFRLEQRGQAARGRASADALDALDAYVDDIVEIATSSDPGYIREYRLQGLIERSDVQLPFNAAFPAADGGQAHFLGSPLWHDRLTFDAGAALQALQAPVLVIVGSDPLDIPFSPYVEAIGVGLSGAAGSDQTICIVEARPRHAFHAPVVTAMATWLDARIGDGAGESRAEAASPLPPGCVE